MSSIDSGIAFALSAIATAASELSATVLEATAAKLERFGTAPLSERQIERLIKDTPGIAHRLQLTELFKRLRKSGANLPPVALAWALRGAGAQDASHAQERIDLVWTGPEASAIKPRESYGALIEVIDSSRETLTIASFAAYRIDAVRVALRRAVARGVHVRLILESSAASAGKIDYEPLAALGLTSADGVEVYVWPLGKRQTNAAGQHGSLHMKCAVADSRLVLISSANLTEHALNLNMEMGVIIQSPTLGQELSGLLDGLIEKGLLVEPLC